MQPKRMQSNFCFAYLCFGGHVQEAIFVSFCWVCYLQSLFVKYLTVYNN